MIGTTGWLTASYNFIERVLLKCSSRSKQLFRFCTKEREQNDLLKAENTTLKAENATLNSEIEVLKSRILIFLEWPRGKQSPRFAQIFSGFLNFFHQVLSGFRVWTRTFQVSIDVCNLF